MAQKRSPAVIGERAIAIAAAPLSRAGISAAALSRACPLTQGLRVGAIGGALFGGLTAAVLAEPAPILVLTSNTLRLIATGVIAGGWVGATFLGAETDLAKLRGRDG
jgi:hypothetical protein